VNHSAPLPLGCGDLAVTGLVYHVWWWSTGRRVEVRADGDDPAIISRNETVGRMSLDRYGHRLTYEILVQQMDRARPACDLTYVGTRMTSISRRKRLPSGVRHGREGCANRLRGNPR